VRHISAAHRSRTISHGAWGRRVLASGHRRKKPLAPALADGFAARARGDLAARPGAGPEPASDAVRFRLHPSRVHRRSAKDVDRSCQRTKAVVAAVVTHSDGRMMRRTGPLISGKKTR